MLSVLGYEGPQLRAYLCLLKACGLPVTHLMLMALTRDVSSGKPVARWLSSAMRTSMALKLQDARMNFWPRRIAHLHPACYAAVTQQMASRYGFDPALYETMRGHFDWSSYAEKLSVVPVENLRDPNLTAWLSAHVRGAVLFTGGGILPASILAVPNLRFLHFHPGFLPHVRGADGLLWSILLRGRPGISGFYMNAGIDTGDLVMAREEAALRFDLTAEATPDAQTLYRALFSYIDPMIRAKALCDLLASGYSPDAFPATPQEVTAGETYHFMHPMLRGRTLRRLFPQLTT
jgi:hypothetical protein